MIEGKEGARIRGSSPRDGFRRPSTRGHEDDRLPPARRVHENRWTTTGNGSAERWSSKVIAGARCLKEAYEQSSDG
jgi:hypothetical protein